MATQYFLIIIGLQFQWLEFHIKIHGMAGKQCDFSDQKAGKRSLFSETWAGISTSTQWTPCMWSLISQNYGLVLLFVERVFLFSSVV